MPRPFAKTALLSVAASCLLCLPASAKYMKTIKVTADSNPFGGPVIEVESDGETWTRIKQGSKQLGVGVAIKAGVGWRITNAFIGVPSADFTGTSIDDIPDAIRSLGGSHQTKEISRHETHTFHTDDLVFDRNKIIDLCNSDGRAATQEFSKFTTIGVGIKAFFQKRRNRELQQAGQVEGRSETAHTDAPVTVRCLAGPSHVEAPPRPISIDIRVKQTGKTCPKDTEVTAYIDYDKPMTARFRVIHNGTEPKSDPIEIKARKVSFAGKTWYRVERMERYKLDPGKHTFQIKVLGRGGLSPTKTVTVDCPPFKPTSMWLTLNKSGKATCPKNVDAKVRVNGNGPGSVLTKIKNQAGVVMAIESIKVVRDGDQYVGHLTKSFNMTAIKTMLIAEDVNDPAHNTGWQPLEISCLEVMSGTLQQRGFAANLCKGEAALSIRANQSGKIPYRLECTGGRAWQGTVDAHKTGPDTYIGVQVVKFDVSNNELVRCALRTSPPLSYKLLAGAKRTYECHRTTGASGTDDIVSDTRPDPQAPQRDVIVIDTGPQMSCDGGVIKTGKCVCPRTHKSVAAGENAFRCVRTAVVDPVRPDRDDRTVDVTPDYGKQTRQDAEADRRRLEALKRRQEAKKRAEAAARRKAAQEAAAAKRRRDAAMKAAAERRKREAAKRAAAAQRRRLAAQKAAAAKRKREAAKKAAAAQQQRLRAVAR